MEIDLTNIDTTEADKRQAIIEDESKWRSRGNYYYRETSFGYEIYFDFYQHECDEEQY